MAESAEPSNSDDDPVAVLHRELAPMLARLARAILRDGALADDAVQEAFMLLTVRLDQVPVPQRPGWLVRTVQLSALNLRRGQNRHAQIERRWAVAEQRADYQQGSTADQQLEQTEELNRLRAALGQLPQQQQLIVRLRLVEGQTFQQIADQLKLPLGTVLSRMRLAIEKLRLHFNPSQPS